MDLIEIHKKDLITWRKFLVLVRGLPQDSAFKEWLRDKKKRNFITYRGQ